MKWAKYHKLVSFEQIEILLSMNNFKSKLNPKIISLINPILIDFATRIANTPTQLYSFKIKFN